MCGKIPDTKYFRVTINVYFLVNSFSWKNKAKVCKTSNSGRITIL